MGAGEPPQVAQEATSIKWNGEDPFAPCAASDVSGSLGLGSCRYEGCEESNSRNSSFRFGNGSFCPSCRGCSPFLADPVLRVDSLLRGQCDEALDCCSVALGGMNHFSQSIGFGWIEILGQLF